MNIMINELEKKFENDFKRQKQIDNKNLLKVD